MPEFDRSRILEGFQPGLICASLGGDGAVAVHPRNEDGRDFVVGDIHGMFEALESALKSLEFRTGLDRLFSVGDLIDRGPNSAHADRWIRDCPWFHAVRGNHDQMLLDAIAAPDQLRFDVMDLWIRHNGGEWWLDTEEPLRRSIAAAMASLPLAAEIECDHGLVGVVHADVPPDRDWSEFLRALCLGVREDAAHALWSRYRLSGFLNGASREHDLAVSGIGLVVSGHVPLNAPLQMANRWWIDTGAAYSGRFRDPRLTLLQIHPGEPVAHEFSCFRTIR